MRPLFRHSFWILATRLSCHHAQPAHLSNLYEPNLPPGTETVHYTSAQHTLGGLLLEPDGDGPFPAVLYNHGDEPGWQSNEAFAHLAPAFAARGWVFFMPYRRGQGLSAAAGQSLRDEVEQVRHVRGDEAADKTQLWLLQTDQLADQIAARTYLASLPHVQAHRIAVMGDALGGIEAMLGAEQGGYCAGVYAGGAAQSGSASAELRDRLVHAVDNTRVPLFFFQAKNAVDVPETRALYEVQHGAGRPAELKIYRAFGANAAEARGFVSEGVTEWSGDAIGFLEKSCKF
jgi:carboxymethylenebutenolidase